MKNIITLIAFALSLSLFAQDKVELNAKNVNINSHEAVVVRTNQTPSTVEINFLVPMDKSICERLETRFVMRTSEVHCGNEPYTRRVQVVSTCSRRQSRSNDCVNHQGMWREERHYRPRTCLVSENYCVKYGTVKTIEKDAMKIQFKNLPALADSESETFEIKARQKNYDGENVVYDVKPLETVREYKVTQKRFLGFKIDSYVVEEK